MDTAESHYAETSLPLKSYTALMGTYAAAFGTLFYLATRKKRKLPVPSNRELALLTVGSFKLARIVTMSFIASPIRAPFTRRGESLPGGEVQDEARGRGLQKAIGNMLTCPFCFNVWASTAFVFGYAFAPRAAIKAAEVLSVAAGGDVLHLGYRGLRERVDSEV